VCIALCTIVAHNIAQNRPDSFPPYPPDNHHISDDVYLREVIKSTKQLVTCTCTWYLFSFSPLWILLCTITSCDVTNHCYKQYIQTVSPFLNDFSCV